jgi:hypothetical protein
MKKGRYDHLKSKPVKKINTRKKIEKIALFLVLAATIAVFIVRIVMNLK